MHSSANGLLLFLLLEGAQTASEAFGLLKFFRFIPNIFADIKFISTL
jgi:hypothetical protein